MEESCAVCAEVMEWVAYGQCGHVDVCAVCIARLRFVCQDRRCCICKSLSPFVFLTRAVGSLTRVINDFSILPADPKDGKVGAYWFHEGIQAYFDNVDAYKIIRDMCRLSCNVCDKSETEGSKTSKRRVKFKSIEQLKDHLSRQHELFLCSLCLENKKVFICEQKLYSRVQLRQHIRYGDSEADGNETERCGFSGHPLCEFCQTPFYGDNELYFHMSTEHFTCHICKRQHPTQFDYYKDYHDLEDHFGDAHFLCEDNACLDKKFIVFETEADMKRHVALEHGGNMSRSKRKAALQLRTCFHSREIDETVHRVGAHVCVSGVSNRQVASATSVCAEGTSSNFLHDSSSTIQRVPPHRGATGIGSSPSRVSSSGQFQGTTLDFRRVLLNGPEFPPLSGTSKRRRRKSKKNSQIGADTTQLHQTPSSSASSSQPRGTSFAGPVLNSRPAMSPQITPLEVGQPTSSTSVNPPSAIYQSVSANLSCKSAKRVGPSSSTADFGDQGSVGPSACLALKDDNVHAANRSLVDSICASLGNDEDRFAAFKIISKEYCDDEIDAREYLANVHQFGLTHLIEDLARLCPDPQKRKELMELYKTSTGDINENRLRKECGQKSSKNIKKGKGKYGHCENIREGEALPDAILNQMKELKLNPRPSVEDPSSSNGLDHAAKGKSKMPAATEMPGICSVEYQGDNVGCSNGCEPRSSTVTIAKGDKKKTKKTSKFLKSRLGESSASVAPDLSRFDVFSDLMVVRPDQDSILASIRGVWRNGGGRRLVSLSEAQPSTR